MTYSTGGLIEATDYNTFAGNTTAGLNRVWSTGAGDAGWGQTDIAVVSAGGVVTATNWATLVNSLTTAGSQTSTTLTSRTAPVTGNIVSILANVQTDITSVTTNRGNAASSGAEVGYASGTTTLTTNFPVTSPSKVTWTITFTHTVTFPSANQARYFWNAGGRVRLQFGKTTTGFDIDPDWNTLAGQPGSIYLTGRVNSAAQTIAAVSYTGTTRIGGTGGTQTTLATTTGWYQLIGTPTTIFQLNNATAPYTGEYIQTTATQTSSTVLTLVTTWFQPAVSAAGTSTNITGGTAPALGAITITGTGPTTLCTYFPPSTAQGLSNSWGTPVIAATTSVA